MILFGVINFLTMKYKDKYHFKTIWETTLAEERIKNKYGNSSIFAWCGRQEIQIRENEPNRLAIIKILREYDGAFSS